MKFEFDTHNLKVTKDKLMQQVRDNPLAAGAVGAGLLQGSSSLMNALTKRKNAKTASKNAKSWSTEVKRRDRAQK